MINLAKLIPSRNNDYWCCVINNLWGFITGLLIVLWRGGEGRRWGGNGDGRGEGRGWEEERGGKKWRWERERGHMTVGVTIIHAVHMHSLYDEESS